MKTLLRLPGFVPLTVGSVLVVVLAVWVTLLATSTERSRMETSYAESALAQAREVADVMLATPVGTTASAGQLAASIAQASGVNIAFVDTATFREPTVLGSSSPATPGLVGVARRHRVLRGAETDVAVDTVDGESFFVASSYVEDGPGDNAAMLLALIPADAPAVTRGALRVVPLLAMLVAGVLMVVLAMWAAERMASPLRHITLVTRRAADGEGGGVTLRPDGGFIEDLSKGVQGLVLAMQEQRQTMMELKKKKTPEPDPEVKSREEEQVDGANLEPGQVFAERYEILERLGASKVRTAYKVRDRELDDVVTLKTLQEGLFAGDSAAVERFRGDLRVARRLAHPNILRVDDFGQWGGVYFVTMDYIAAKPLRALIASNGEGGLAVSRAVEIMSQVCTGLMIAHGDGVLHRDLRPESILIDERGVAKLADFGLASPAHQSRASAEGLGDPLSSAYLAPEVLRAEPVDQRADLYAVGVNLFEVLGGQLPFAEADRERIAPPDVSELNESVPVELANLIRRLLANQPDDRPETAEEVRASLEAFA